MRAEQQLGQRGGSGSATFCTAMPLLEADERLGRVGEVERVARPRAPRSRRESWLATTRTAKPTTAPPARRAGSAAGPGGLAVGQPAASSQRARSRAARRGATRATSRATARTSRWRTWPSSWATTRRTSSRVEVAQERVVEHHALRPPEPGDVGVGGRRAPARVDLEDLADLDARAPGQVEDVGARASPRAAA